MSCCLPDSQGVPTWLGEGSKDWECPICIKCLHIHDSRSCPPLAPSASRNQPLSHLIMAARRAPSGVITQLGLSSHTSVFVQGKWVCSLSVPKPLRSWASCSIPEVRVIWGRPEGRVIWGKARRGGGGRSAAACGHGCSHPRKNPPALCSGVKLQRNNPASKCAQFFSPSHLRWTQFTCDS